MTILFGILIAFNVILGIVKDLHEPNSGNTHLILATILLIIAYGEGIVR